MLTTTWANRNSPTLILIGSPGDIALALVTAALGVWLVSAALAGYFSGRLSAVMRAAFAISGALCLIPAGAFPGTGITDLVGAVAGLAVMASETLRSRRGVVA